MKEITTEIRERIFALYWGQNVAYHNTHHYLTVGVRIDNILIPYSEKHHMLLTPLSAITDEHAIEVAEIVSCWDDGASPLDVDDVSEWIDEVMSGNCATAADYVSGEQILQLTDFLRSKGYALPAFGYSVDELVQAKIFKLKTPTNEK